jgi:hypothetical protein
VQQPEARLRVKLLHRTAQRAAHRRWRGLLPAGGAPAGGLEDADASLSSAVAAPGGGCGWMCPARWPAWFSSRRCRPFMRSTPTSSSTWA